MKREDPRDEALGALLREAADWTARGTHRVSLVGERTATRPQGRGYARFAVAAVAAALVAAFLIPAFSRRAEARGAVQTAAEDLSRSLIPEFPPLFASLPARSEVESAAAAFSESLFAFDL